MEVWAFRTMDKKWLLSLASLPPGETRVREKAAEIPFFRSLLEEARKMAARAQPIPTAGDPADRLRQAPGGVVGVEADFGEFLK